MPKRYSMEPVESPIVLHSFTYFRAAAAPAASATAGAASASGTRILSVFHLFVNDKAAIGQHCPKYDNINSHTIASFSYADMEPDKNLRLHIFLPQQN